MCFNAPTSITIFSICLVSAIYLYFIEKNNKNNKFFAILVFLIGLMQLLEFFLWKNQSCDYYNHVFSLLILVLITLQPIVAVNYYIYLHKSTLFNNILVVIYSVSYTIFTSYILNKLNKVKLCSKPTKKSCRLNWDVFNKLSKHFPKYIGLTFIFLYFAPILWMMYDGLINSKNYILKYPIRHAFLPSTFLFTFFYVCYKQKIMKKVIMDPTIYIDNTDVWGSMWCFMAAFLGLIGILKI